jgi:hypothetical protein
VRRGRGLGYRYAASMTLAERIFAGLADMTLRRPLLVLVIAAVLVALAASRIPGLGVSTSRYGMVSADNPDQARMLRFFDRFGNPDAPVFVLSGGTADDRRAVVDRITAALEQQDSLRGRVLARIGPQEVAEVVLLQQPDALAAAAKALPPGVAIAPVVEGGLPAWFGAIAGQIQAGLDGEAPADPAAAAKGLRGLADVAKTFDLYLAGEDVLGRLGEPPPQDGAPHGRDERGYLITVDGQHHVISMFPRLTGDDITDVLPLVTTLRTIRDDALATAPAGVTAQITGLPALIVDEQHCMQPRDAGVERGLGAGDRAAVPVLMLRSLRQTLIAQVPLIYGVALTLAFVRLVLQRPEPDHLELRRGAARARHRLRGAHDLPLQRGAARPGTCNRTAIEASVVHTGPAIVIGALVTAVAFASTLLTEFTAYAELGLITVFGLGFMVLCSLLVLPALLLRRAGRGIAEPCRRSRRAFAR